MKQEILNIEETGLKVGEKYTVLSISDFMATTLKYEIQITGFKPVEEYAQYKNVLMIIFKQKGKRKEQGFYLKKSDVFLKGWDLPIMIDSETGTFRGNALINLIVPEESSVEELRDNINNHFVYGDKSLMFYNLINENNGDGKPLFVELAMNHLDHAIINRIMEKEGFNGNA